MTSVSAAEARLYAIPAADCTGPVSEWAPDDAPAGPWSLGAAHEYCERIATSRHENFPVASRFVPSALRPHVWAIYAFARIADDFSDEPRYEGRRHESLDRWERLLDLCYRDDVDHPVFLALRDAVRAHDIPIADFKSLLTAFRMDLKRSHYTTFKELRQYCEFSASPIGRLVLYVHGHRAPDLHRFSDEICVALQIANQLQDLSIDLPRDRNYLPVEDQVHFGVRGDDLLSGHHSTEFKELMCHSVARTRAMFLRGKPLIRRVGSSFSVELEATWRGGMRILDRIEELDYEVLRERPSLEKRDMADIALRSMFSFGRRFLSNRR
jgi:squalene synthase HpnC